MSIIKTYQSDVSASIHELVQALHSIGAIDRKTMMQFVNHSKQQKVPV